MESHQLARSCSNAKKLLMLIAVGIHILTAHELLAQKRAIDAQLKIESSVDLCSKDSTFILTVNLGTLKTEDSLLLYDMSLSFPLSRARFIQVLYSNTLSAGLEYKDHVVTARNVLRVYGFNVSSPIVGSAPLFAALFKVVGACTDSIPIGFNSVPDANPEAKVYYRSLEGTPVPLKIQDSPLRSLKFEFSNDTIAFSSLRDSQQVQVNVTVPGSARLYTLGMRLHYDTSAIRVTDVGSLTEADSIMSQVTGSGLDVVMRSLTGLNNTSGITFWIRRTDSSSTIRNIQIDMFDKDSCACITRSQDDTVAVLYKPVNVAVDEHESTDDSADETLINNGDVWEFNKPSGLSLTAHVFSLVGKHIMQIPVTDGHQIHIDKKFLDGGVYLVSFTTSSGMRRMKKIFN